MRKMRMMAACVCVATLSACAAARAVDTPSTSVASGDIAATATTTSATPSGGGNTGDGSSCGGGCQSVGPGGHGSSRAGGSGDFTPQTFTGNHLTETLECDDAGLVVSGDDNRLTIGDHCAVLSVTGAHNTITVAGADTINAGGSGNHITFAASTPTVVNTGRGDVVGRG